uniref:DUF4258 domain-containing protein n=1 Tax=Syphacia muris TaxID=451379 RepID=A0A0N5AL78_9BILA
MHQSRESVEIVLQEVCVQHLSSDTMKREMAKQEFQYQKDDEICYGCLERGYCVTLSVMHVSILLNTAPDGE